VHLLKGGASLRHIQAFLGHKTVETTARYTHLVLDDLKETHTSCHPREQMEI
jgi:site-specific recombinase XerD